MPDEEFDSAEAENYMVFDAMVLEEKQKVDTTKKGAKPVTHEWADLIGKMANPFSVMRRWLKYEILDLEAILEAI